MRWLSAVFFCSGFAALLYQVVWQRSLFAIYGVNSESVTVVVTAFMLGLGLGSLAGGARSKQPGAPILRDFAFIEIALGVFGFSSLRLFHAVGSVTLTLPPWCVALVTFALLLIPTMAMGATLPLLVAHTVARSKNVGDSVGVLYSVNTLGSAFAALASVLFILGSLGQLHTTWLAAAINFIVGAAVLAFRRHIHSSLTVSESTAASSAVQ